MLTRLHNLGMSEDSEIAVLGIPQPSGCAPFVIGTLGAAFEFPMDLEETLTRNDERLIRELGGMLDRQLLAVLSSRSVSEFTAVRAEVWPKYIRALRALSDTMRNMKSEHYINRLATASMADFKTDLDKQRGVRFGDSLTDQAIFTLWTLEKIRSLSFQLVGKMPAPEQRGTDLQLNKEYRLCSLWAQFHMDVVVAAMNHDKTVPGDVQDALCDGLRTAVNAYAIMKDALALRRPRAQEPAAVVLPWDEEDEQLLAASMRDLNGAVDNL